MSSRRSQIERLRAAFGQNRIVLVLGSGISSPHGIPTWTTLLKELAEEIIQAGPVNLEEINEGLGNSPLVLARFLATEASGHENFREVLRRVLYRRLAYNPRERNLKAVVRFLVESLQGAGDRIVLTYNFDGLLEQALENYGATIPHKTIGPGDRIEDSTSLAIVHCHGHIAKDDATSGKQIIFDEIQYNRQYNSRLDTIDVMQSYCFSQMMCLFLGTSLIDPNTRRLLDGARAHTDNEPRHFIVRLLPGNSIHKRILEADSKSLGVETIWIPNYAGISKILNAINR